MVIDNLDVDRTRRTSGPFKADPPLVIDTDAYCPCRLSFGASSLLPDTAASSFKLVAEPRLGLVCETGKLLDAVAIGKTLGFSVRWAALPGLYGLILATCSAMRRLASSVS